MTFNIYYLNHLPIREVKTMPFNTINKEKTTIKPDAAISDKEAPSLNETLLSDVDTYVRDHYKEEKYKRLITESIRVDNLTTSQTEYLGNYLKEKLKNKLGRILKGDSESKRDNKSFSFERPRLGVLSNSSSTATSIDNLIGKRDEPFSRTLLRLIYDKGKTDVEVYKRAHIGSKLFSKIRKDDYTPSKKTVFALAIGLELNLEETESLLACAGYSFSRNKKFDIIVQYFIVKGRYDIFQINDVLLKYDQQLLGEEARK